MFLLSIEVLKILISRTRCLDLALAVPKIFSPVSNISLTKVNKER